MSESLPISLVRIEREFRRITGMTVPTGQIGPVAAEWTLANILEIIRDWSPSGGGGGAPSGAAGGSLSGTYPNPGLAGSVTALFPTAAEKAALDGAASPSGGNPFATIADLAGLGVPDPLTLETYLTIAAFDQPRANSGAIRLGIAAEIQARNGDDSANIPLLSGRALAGSEAAVLGDVGAGSGYGSVFTNSLGEVQLRTTAFQTPNASSLYLSPTAGFQITSSGDFGIYNVDNSDGFFYNLGSRSFEWAGPVLFDNLITMGVAVAFGAAPAQSGAVRLENTAAINWRNFADDGDAGLSLDGSNTLQLAGADGLNISLASAASVFTILGGAGGNQFSVGLNSTNSQWDFIDNGVSNGIQFQLQLDSVGNPATLNFESDDNARVFNLTLNSGASRVDLEDDAFSTMFQARLNSGNSVLKLEDDDNGKSFNVQVNGLATFHLQYDGSTNALQSYVGDSNLQLEEDGNGVFFEVDLGNGIDGAILRMQNPSGVGAFNITLPIANFAFGDAFGAIIDIGPGNALKLQDLPTVPGGIDDVFAYGDNSGVGATVLANLTTLLLTGAKLLVKST